jgi:hypothetical protein
MASKARNEASLAEQITDLPIGESIAKCLRFPMADLAEDGIKDGLAKLRSGLNQTVSRIRKRTGQEYRVESGTMLTDDQEAIIATVCVTRMGDGEGGAEDDLGI